MFAEYITELEALDYNPHARDDFWLDEDFGDHTDGRYIWTYVLARVSFVFAYSGQQSHLPICLFHVFFSFGVCILALPWHPSYPPSTAN